MENFLNALKLRDDQQGVGRLPASSPLSALQDELEVSREKERYLYKQITELRTENLKLQNSNAEALRNCEEKNNAIRTVQDELLQVEIEHQMMEEKWRKSQELLVATREENQHLIERWVERINAEASYSLGQVKERP